MTVLTMPGLQAHTAHNLTEMDITLMRAATSRLPGAWSAATELDYQGKIIAVLMPDGDDAAGPSFHLERQPEGIVLGACRWDAFTRLGTHPDMDAAIAAAARYLAA